MGQEFMKQKDGTEEVENLRVQIENVENLRVEKMEELTENGNVKIGANQKSANILSLYDGEIYRYFIQCLLHFFIIMKGYIMF